MPSIGAQLLALRSYLRAGAALAQRWSWTDRQIEAFAGSQHEQELSAAIQAVRGEFERDNPGYTLSVNPQVRTLDRQLQAWNANDSVAAAGREFEAAASRAIQSSIGSRQAGITPQAFARFVMDHQPQPLPTLAAPGLSRHGQMYAVDFHVSRGEATVADTDSATIASVCGSPRVGSRSCARQSSHLAAPSPGRSGSPTSPGTTNTIRGRFLSLRKTLGNAATLASGPLRRAETMRAGGSSPGKVT